MTSTYLERVRARLAATCPPRAGLGLRKTWAATIDYTPDHLPILAASPGRGPRDRERGGPRDDVGPGGCAGGRPAGILRQAPTSSTCRTSGLDRFDAEGRSRLATDPIALPFPSVT